MRRNLIIVLIMAMAVPAMGQSNWHSDTGTAGYLSFSPEDRGIGMRLDMQKVYASFSFGDYRLPYGGYIKDHTKLAVGILYDWFTLGMTYHDWGDTKETVQLYGYNLRHYSIEAGGRIQVIGRFVAAFRYDILRREGTVDFGISF